MDFLTTIPGLLIVCGVILLVIAFIIFIVSASKSKKAKKDETNIENKEVTPAVASAPINEMPVNTNVNNANFMPEVAAPTTPVEMVAPVVDTTVQQPEVVPTDLNNTITSIPQVDAPVMMPVEETPFVAPIPEVAPINTVPTEEIVQPATINTGFETPDATNLDKTQVSVYGGTNPTDAISPAIEEVKPTIYGGNDPLEATQKLPVVEENHVPYGGVQPVDAVIPAVDNVAPVADVQPMTMEQAVPVTPEVTPIPTVEPVQVVEEAEEL